MPQVSIIMPTFNSASFIQKTFDSVCNQTFRDFEFFIVDDGSHDETPEIIRRFAAKDGRISLIFQDHSGMPAIAKNVALQKVAGKFICFVDSDDIWEPDKLEKQVQYLNTKKSIDLLGTGAIVIDGNGREKYRFLNPLTDEDIRKKILIRNMFVATSVMIRRACLEGNTLFQPIRIGEDYDLWLRIGMRSRMANLPEYLVRYREHSTNMTKDLQTVLKSRMEILPNYRYAYPHYSQAVLLDFFRSIIYSLPLWKKILGAKIRIKNLLGR